MTVDERWIAALESRHLADLRFQEVSRALRALSSAYVERRHRLAQGVVLDGAGKRAAMALFYAPIHFFLVRRIIRALSAAEPAPCEITDLGCGTGVAGAAWALEAGGRPRVLGIDRHPWCVAESAWTYATLGVHGRVRQDDFGRFAPSKRPGGLIAAFAINELTDEARAHALRKLLDAIRHRHTVLVIEPLARAALSWWGEWQGAFEEAGGQAHEWRFPSDLPELVRKLDRAAGLDHRLLTGRTLFFQPKPGSES
jgi:hypothetical protein